jgi:phage baseplate assembly protein W
MAIPLYRGFATAKFLQTRKTFAIANQDTVKADLLNHLYTIKGERPHRPDFGTRIPLLAFEPLDEKTLAIVREDLEQVVAFDPRVELIDMAVMAAPDNNAIIAYVDLYYKQLDIKETFKLEIDVAG